MTNKEKAKEIAKTSQFLSDFPHHEPSVEYGAIKMAEWKNEQIRNTLAKIYEESYDWKKENCRNDKSFLDCGQIMEWIFVKINNDL